MLFPLLWAIGAAQKSFMCESLTSLAVKWLVSELLPSVMERSQRALYFTLRKLDPIPKKCIAGKDVCECVCVSV